MTATRTARSGASLQQRLAAGTAALVVLTSLASVGYAVMASRAFYFELRTEALTAAVRSVEAVVRTAADDDAARAALDGLLTGEPLVGVVRGRVTLDGRPLLHRDLTAEELARIDAAMTRMTTDSANKAATRPRFTEVRLDDGDHEVVRWETTVPRGTLQVTLADPDSDTLARRDREVLLAIGTTTTIAAAGIAAAWMIVAIGLRPIHRVAVAIDGIGDRPAPCLPTPASSAPREIQPLLDALDRLLRRLDLAFARERRFTADAAHELRTPIAGLRSTIELARSRPRDAAADDRALADAAESTARLERLAADLLDLASADSASELRHEDHGRGQPGSSCDLAAAIRVVVEERRPRAAARRIRIDLNLPLHAVQVPLSPVEAARMVANLVDNAIEHGPADATVGIRLTAGGHGTVSDGRPVRLEVRDQGHRLHPADLERIFDRFVRIPSSSDDPGRNGTGLGLSLVRELVTRTGGRVSAACDPIAGTRFTVDLPRTHEPNRPS